MKIIQKGIYHLTEPPKNPIPPSKRGGPAPNSTEWKVTQRGITSHCSFRSHLCPDHSCDVLWTDYSKFLFDRGLSHFCIGRAYGAAGLVFTEKKTIHENDLCKCIYTPLKGMLRYFTNLEDFTLETAAMLRVMDKLKPLKCDFCHQDVERLSAVLTVMKDGKKKCYRCIAKEGGK